MRGLRLDKNRKGAAPRFHYHSNGEQNRPAVVGRPKPRPAVLDSCRKFATEAAACRSSTLAVEECRPIMMLTLTASFAQYGSHTFPALPRGCMAVLYGASEPVQSS